MDIFGHCFGHLDQHFVGHFVELKLDGIDAHKGDKVGKSGVIKQAPLPEKLQKTC